jgi:transposase-like protein
LQTQPDRFAQKKTANPLQGMGEKILFLYAKVMSTLEIIATHQELYDVDVSASLTSNITNAVLEDVVQWQSRPLDSAYLIVYVDCIDVKVRQDKQIINTAIYLALGVRLEGHKELLGMWLLEDGGRSSG